ASWPCSWSPSRGRSCSCARAARCRPTALRLRPETREEVPAMHHLSRRQASMARLLLCRSGYHLLTAALLAAAWAAPAAADCSLTATGATPLPDLGGGLYQGFPG